MTEYPIPALYVWIVLVATYVFASIGCWLLYKSIHAPLTKRGVYVLFGVVFFVGSMGFPAHFLSIYPPGVVKLFLQFGPTIVLATSFGIAIVCSLRKHKPTS